MYCLVEYVERTAIKLKCKQNIDDTNCGLILEVVKSKDLNSTNLNEMLWATNGGISAWRQINSISRQLLKFILEIKRNKTFQEKRMLRMHDQSFLAYTKLQPPCCSNKLAANGLKCLEKLTSYVHTLLSCTHTSNTASVDSWQLQIAEHVDKTERLRTQISMWRRERFSTTKGRHSNIYNGNVQ